MSAATDVIPSTPVKQTKTFSGPAPENTPLSPTPLGNVDEATAAALFGARNERVPAVAPEAITPTVVEGTAPIAIEGSDSAVPGGAMGPPTSVAGGALATPALTGQNWTLPDMFGTSGGVQAGLHSAGTGGDNASAMYNIGLGGGAFPYAGNSMHGPAGNMFSGSNATVTYDAALAEGGHGEASFTAMLYSLQGSPTPTRSGTAANGQGQAATCLMPSALAADAAPHLVATAPPAAPSAVPLRDTMEPALSAGTTPPISLHTATPSQYETPAASSSVSTTPKPDAVARALATSVAVAGPSRTGSGAGPSGTSAVAASRPPAAAGPSTGGAPVGVVFGGAPSAAKTALLQKMDLARIAAMAKEHWLANGADVRSTTDWYRDGRADILVDKAAADAAREAQAAHAADPGVVPAAQAPSKAHLTTIGTITTDRAYLTCDGNYKGPNPTLPFQKAFAQTTLTCALGPPPPEFSQLVADYHAGQNTLRSLLPKGVTERSGHVYQNIGSQHYRLRHAVFAPRPAPGEEDEADEAALPAQFTIRGWHTNHPAAAQELEKIVDTHVARPLPAFDLRGDLIPPSRYVQELRGATVVASFSVTTFHINEKHQNGRDTTRLTVCLDIEYLRVLIAPPQFSPKKRSAIHLTDPLSRAAKKQRTICVQ